MKLAIAILALTVVGTQPLLAQGKSKEKTVVKTEYKGKGGKQTEEIKTEHKVDSRGNVTTKTKVKANGNSPSFCRSGAGHPVHGRGWCADKGFAVGNNVTWTRNVWNDAVFQDRRSPTVTNVLSSVVLGRLNTYASQQLGLTTPLTGSWLVSSPTRQVYVVRSGTSQVAEFVDSNGDGRADYVLLNHR